eukprot:s1602_g7.t4
MHRIRVVKPLLTACATVNQKLMIPVQGGGCFIFRPSFAWPAAPMVQDSAGGCKGPGCNCVWRSSVTSVEGEKDPCAAAGRHRNGNRQWNSLLFDFAKLNVTPELWGQKKELTIRSTPKSSVASTASSSAQSLQERLGESNVLQNAREGAVSALSVASERVSGAASLAMAQCSGF